MIDQRRRKQYHKTARAVRDKGGLGNVMGGGLGNVMGGSMICWYRSFIMHDMLLYQARGLPSRCVRMHAEDPE